MESPKALPSFTERCADPDILYLKNQAVIFSFNAFDE
jgi:hypothetical protein